MKHGSPRQLQVRSGHLGVAIQAALYVVVGTISIVVGMSTHLLF